MAVTEAQQIADILLAALVVRLRNEGLDQDLCARAVYPGAMIPIDYAAESCGGMAYVRLNAVVPTTTFPAPETSPMACVATLAYTFEVGVLRPAPHIEVTNGEPEMPEDAEQNATAYSQYTDMMAIRSAVQDVREDIEYVVLGGYTPAGPDGGAVGGWWTVTLGQDL
jgi:hypothetical protein